MIGLKRAKAAGEWLKARLKTKKGQRFARRVFDAATEIGVLFIALGPLENILGGGAHKKAADFFFGTGIAMIIAVLLIEWRVPDNDSEPDGDA